LSSARIPLSAFTKSGFSINKVKKIWITLGNQSSKGGLFFGDVYASSVGSATTAVVTGEPISQAVTAAAQVAAADDVADAPPPSPNIVMVPAADSPADAQTAAPAATAAAVVAADSGNRLVSAVRTTLRVGTGASAPDGNPEAAATHAVPAIELTVASSRQIVEGDAMMAVRIGGRQFDARRFATGRETDQPSVIKLVVPAEAIDGAADGASLAVVSGGSVHQFGPLAKRTIR
jgi:hypothetical protein